jgi:hypothetical protein
VSSDRYRSDRDYRDQIDLVAVRSMAISDLIGQLAAIRDQYGEVRVAAVRDSNGQLCVVSGPFAVADGVATFEIDD